MQGCGIRSRKPKLIDMAGRNRLDMQAVRRDLMGGAGEAERPDRALLAVAHHCDDGHARKLRRIVADYRGDEKGQRQGGEDPGRTPPKEDAVPKFRHPGDHARPSVDSQPRITRVRDEKPSVMQLPF